LKISLSHIATKRLTAAPAANSKRYTNELNMKAAQFAGGMMVRMTTMQIKRAAGQMAH
jgi:hypothetical protein